MSNFKNELNNWQQVPRELVFDKTITDRARFVYVYMACKPDDWVFHASAMSKDLGYSEETTRKYIKELISKGWLSKEEQSRVKGVFGNVIYTLHATQKSPCTEKAESDKNRDGENSSLYNRELKHNSDNRDTDSININETSLDSTPLPPKQPKQKKQSYNSELGIKVREWWKEYCPNLQQPSKWSRSRDADIAKLLKDTESTEEDLKKAIMLVGCSSNCQGRGKVQDGHSKVWKANIDWLLKNTKDCFTNIFDGVKYHWSDGDYELYQKVMNGEDVKDTRGNTSPTEETPTTDASEKKWQ